MRNCFIRISKDEAERLNVFIGDVEIRLNALYAASSDTTFYHRDDMPVLLDGMRQCFIEPNFIGLANYGRLMGDTRFWSALRITAVFTTVSVAIELVLGMALALIL